MISPTSLNALANRGLPADTRSLLKQLDAAIQRPAIHDASKLADEGHRLQMAEAAGSRALVEKLLDIQRRHDEDGGM